jgi:hypothetical protein
VFNLFSVFSEWIELHLPGAEAMSISFDPKTKTEEKYDYVRFCREKGKLGSGTTISNKFSGDSGWPGTPGTDALIIEGDRAWVYFESDGSTEYW